MSSSNERAKSARNECVQVVVRCRPMNEKELMHGHENVVSVYPSRGVVEIFNPKDDDRSSAKMFTYDAVYDSGASQRDLYEESVFPLVSSVLEGFNGTIFAYGQTGTGKTYTMEGRGTANSDNRGIIPRSFDQIFTHISRSDNMQYLVRASYLEIYQEEIRDLLDTNPKKRYELRESVDSGVYVKDLQSFVCKSISEIEKLMATGNQNRTIGATNMNEHSSRSHAIFMVTIEMSDTSNQEIKNQYQEEISRLRAMLENTNDSSTMNKKKKRKKDDDGEEKTHEEMLNEEEANLIKREKKVMNDDMPETERKRLLQEIEARKLAILEEKKAHEELTNRIQAMESKLLRGGKNIIDHTNEQQKALEQRTIEINERKRKELQMRQMLEMKEDSMEGIRETYASLQQEIEAKNNKVKKLYQKLQSIRQEVQDTTENFNADRRELEDHHNALLKDYKLQLLIIDNFIPPEERKRISSRLFYDDEEDVWKMMPESEPTKVLGRMKSNAGERRPLTEYAKTAREIGLNYRYKGENILELDLEYPLRSTKDYQGPAVAPSVLSALEAALKGEDDIDVDASPSMAVPKRGLKSAYGRSSNKPTYPKTRGLVPK
ncbi:hypothetical protein GE061_017155 [Apolygus lucorum]|uniref:Kinesin motor domain-containing protein n=1 Tax=Apolygus lucorum TaxID=248454 RepID=A0A8S9XI94_APOLU|nr:hypothetical protein GE061_017155 [Apolygus lucorum]